MTSNARGVGNEPNISFKRISPTAKELSVWNSINYRDAFFFVWKLSGFVKMILDSNICRACKFFVLVATLVAGWGVVDAQAEGNKIIQPTRALLTIENTPGVPQVKGLRVALNKSVLIELPREAQDVLVANPAIVDAVVHSSRRINLIGKSIGQSSAVFTDEHGNHILVLEILVEQDISALQAMLSRLIPESNIAVETIRNSIVLTGFVRNPSDATRAVDLASRFVAPTGKDGQPATKKVAQDSIVNMITVDAVEQVMLQVKVVEVQRTVLKQFGINIGALINSGNFVTSFLSANALPLTAAAGLGTIPIPGVNTAGAAAGALGLFNSGPTAAGVPFGNSGVAGSWSTPNNTIVHTIRALERDGLLRTLAEPTLTAVSGEAAKFLAGGEFPVPVVDSQGRTSVTFKEFGIGVSFTPVVLSEDRISLKIETEVSELSTQGAVQLSDISIPALTKRQANSTVELPSGGSIAIAGLLSNKTRQNIDGLPGVKNIPVLGTLFRSRDFINEESELVVIVTPLLVRPVSRKRLSSPDGGFAPASDLRAILLGHLNRIYEWDGPAPLANYDGDIGFILK